MMKWVRIFLNHRAKYNHPPREGTSLSPFLAELSEKQQPEHAGAQVARAVELLLGKVQTVQEVRAGETPAPALGTSALPRNPWFTSGG